MYTVVEGLIALAKSLGVEFEFSSKVENLIVESGSIDGCIVNAKPRSFDYVVASADYQHVDQQLLASPDRSYSNKYWDKRVMAPSCLIFYLGINKKIKNLLHHTLFFDEDFKKHATEIYDQPQWPTTPQFYVCCTSNLMRLLRPLETKIFLS